MRRISVTTLSALSVGLVMAGCAPATAPVQTGSGAATSASAPQKALVIAQRGEPPTLAARSLVTQGSGLLIPDRFFNATLDVWDMNPFLTHSSPRRSRSSIRTPGVCFPTGAWRPATP